MTSQVVAARFGSGPRIAFLHGFTQTAASWRPIASAFAGDRQVVLVDLPGHGVAGSLRAGLDEAADLIAAEVDEAIYVGYSLGARHALHLALRHPPTVSRLVLLGGTAGIEDAAERDGRIAADRRLAESLERDGLDRFLERWLANPLFAGLPAEAAGIDERRQNTVDGLAASLRLAGAGTQSPSWASLHTLEMPVLVVAGELDAKFVALGRRMADSIGANARFVTVAGAGHSAHLERPESFSELLSAFVDG